jgi:hypothetical protein
MSPSAKEVASYTFATIKNGKDFIYEMKLLFVEHTNEYCFLRKWYYAANENMSIWRHNGWNRHEDRRFDMKVVQKKDILNYNVLKALDLRQTNTKHNN